MIQLRPAAAEDASALTDIAFMAKRVWGYPEAVIEHWRPQLTVSGALIGRQPTCVATFEGKAAGFYSVAPGELYWVLDHLWVLPGLMGRGIGRQLLEHALGRVLAAGSKGLDIDSDPNAENFYLRCGARRVGEIPAPIADFPDRIRPQLRLTEMQPNIAPHADARCTAP
jgi:GNAT superfamily N-acetyltransferase